jgi:hypothetical protein
MISAVGRLNELFNFSAIFRWCVVFFFVASEIIQIVRGKSDNVKISVSEKGTHGMFDWTFFNNSNHTTFV